jgi:predicted MFS family arabinose efflux permease
MWLLPLSFFAFQFILRLWPGLMMHQIMEQFSIDATAFGAMAAFYYYGYAGMQIPVAMLLDRFTPRYVIVGFALICGLATFLFTYTDQFYLAVLARFLIGAGSAVGFLGVSKVVSEWFPKEQYARMIGFSFTFGLMGALYGGKPVSALIESYGWQTVALGLGFVFLVIGAATYLILRSPQKPADLIQHDQFHLTNFKAILTSPIIWLLALSNLLMVGSLEGFADVWGVPYLMTAYGLEKGDAAGLVSFVFVGMLFGGPLLALFSRKFGNYPVIVTCGVGMALAFLYLLTSVGSHPYLLSAVLFMVGLMCCYQVIVFAAGADLVAPKNLGVTVAFLNCINMFGGSFFHTLIGKMMDYFWTGTVAADGLRVYDLGVYRQALAIVPTAAIIGSILVCIVALRVKLTVRQKSL